MSSYQGEKRGPGSNERSNMAPLPSPYNFVALSKTVVFPDWADQVSMDVPFKDGVSGTLKIKVTATTPIYIRSGGTHATRAERLDDPRYTDFFRVFDGGPYAIPGASMKGMLRNIIEILSFGKIAGSGSRSARVSNHRYAVRDLQNQPLYGSRITSTVSGAFEPKVKAGWLSEGADGNWVVRMCKYSRVEQTQLEALQPGLDLGGKQSAAGKYAKTGIRLPIMFDPQPVMDHLHSGNNRLRYSEATNLQKGSTEGVLVFTGQPAPRKGPGTKHMEFIFHSVDSRPVTVQGAVRSDFEFAHSELGENRKPNKDWAFWLKELKRGESVPVFVLSDDIDKKGISSMGLAMMFRLPYKHDIHETIAHTTPDHLDVSRPDLAELIFGRVEEKTALRGRISIETALAVGNPQPMGRQVTVLNGPKPTYYPNYIRQNSSPDGQVKGGYRTYMDDKAEIRGWKRYLVRQDSAKMPAVNPVPQRRGEENLDVATAFSPLPASTAFVGDIHIHNLKPIELGALIWALTWGGRKTLRQSLGLGKPYGFGCVSIEIVGSNLTRPNQSAVSLDEKELMRRFEEFMEAAVPEWSKTPQMVALCSMANPGMEALQELRWPKLGEGRGNNEFVEYKKNVMALVEPLTSTRRQPVQRLAPKEADKAPVVLSAVELLIGDALRLKPSEMKKRIDGHIFSRVPMTQEEFGRLVSAWKKNPSGKGETAYTPEDRRVTPSLELLKKQIGNEP